MALTNEEKETIITFDETPADATVFTYNKAWQKHLENKLGLKHTMDNGYGGREYHIAKKRIRPPRAPVKLSAEQRRKMADRLRRGRRQKSIIGAGKTAAVGAKRPKTSGATKSIKRRR